AHARRGAALGPCRDEDVRGTIVASAVTAFSDVADAGRRATDGRALRVHWARGGRTRACLRRVAHAHRGPAFRPRGDEDVSWTVVATPVTTLGHVADASRRATDGRALRVRGTRGSGARARLRRIAHAGRDPALRAHRHERVRGTIVAGAVTALGDVTDAGHGAAHRRTLHVGGT